MQGPLDESYSFSHRDGTTHSENTDDQYITMASFSEDLGAANCRVAVPHMADADLMGVDEDRDWCADSMAVELSSVESAAMNGFMRLLKPGCVDGPSIINASLSFSRNSSFLRRNASCNGLSVNLSHENLPDNHDDYSITSFYSGPSNRNPSDKCSAEGEEEDPMLPMAPPSSPLHCWHPGTNFYSAAPSPPGYAHTMHAPVDAALEPQKWWSGEALSTSMYSLPRGLYANDNFVAGTLQIEVPWHNAPQSPFPHGWTYEDIDDNASDSEQSVTTSLFVEVASLDGEGTYARYGEACADEDASIRDSIDAGLPPLYDSSDSRDRLSHSNEYRRGVLPCVPYYLADSMHHRAGHSVHSVNSPPDAPVRRRYNTPEHEECGKKSSESLERVTLKAFSTDRLVALQCADPSYRHYSGFPSNHNCGFSSNISGESKAGYYGNDNDHTSEGDHGKAKYKRLSSSHRQKQPEAAQRCENGGNGSASSAPSSAKNMTHDANMVDSINRTAAVGKRKRGDHVSGCSPVSALSNEQEGAEHSCERSGHHKKPYTQHWYSSSGGEVDQNYHHMNTAMNNNVYNSSVNNSNVYNTSVVQRSSVHSSGTYNGNGYSACNTQAEDAHKYEGTYGDVREDIELDGYDGASETG